MEVKKCIKERRSIRHFLNKKVEFELITEILEAGIWAPSSGNIQNWNFIVINSKEKKEKIAKACYGKPFIARAPYVIIVLAETKRAEKLYGKFGKRFAIQNISACIENMLLRTHELGLASCWIGKFEEEEIKNILNVPESIEIHAILPIGYAGEKVPAPPRKKLKTKVFFNKWGERWIKNVEKRVR